MTDDLVDDLLTGNHRALARVITKIENRQSGYRDIVARLHEHTGTAEVIGITGSPGSGKSTLVDKLAATYRDQGHTVGVIAIDPSSPFTGGAVLGDRIRMGSNIGDMDVFVRSMSARGTLGGLSTATADAVKALDAFGKDRILVETVGAGQNEIDIVKTADTVTVIVPPGSGDDIQMLKAGILEIADIFVVNKADLSGADRTVRELREMLEYRDEGQPRTIGHHGPGSAASSEEGPPGNSGSKTAESAGDSDGSGVEGAAVDTWTPPIIETVAKDGEGIDELLSAFDDHANYLNSSGRREEIARTRYAAEIRQLIREDINALVAEELEYRGGMDSIVDDVLGRKTDPYSVADTVVAPIADCVQNRRLSK